jgi:hypothetical protein
MFTKSGPNLVTSDEGWQVKVLGRTGIEYTDGDRKMRVDSEILAGPAGMVVYSSSIRTWLPPYEAEHVSDAVRARIVQNIQRSFKFEGLEIDIL